MLINAQIRNEDERKELRQQMKMMIAAQIRNDERFAKSDERFAKSDERFAKSDERFAKSDERFAKFQAQTDKTLKAVMELIKQRKNGKH